MKKIISKKLYDTETAVLIHSWNNGFYDNDFNHCQESLYLTKKGSYFIAGEGGPMSKYATHCGNSSSGGENIEVLEEEETIDWLQNHDGTPALEKHFKNVIKEG